MNSKIITAKNGDVFVYSFIENWAESWDFDDAQFNEIPIVQKLRLKGYNLVRNGKYKIYVGFSLRRKGDWKGELYLLHPSLKEKLNL